LKLSKKILASVVFASGLGLVGCGFLAAVGAWLPFGISVVDGIAAIAVPGNTVIPADINSGKTIFTDLSTAVSAAQAAGAGLTGLSKVVAELGSAIGSQQVVLNDFSAVGLNIPANDLGYVDASENLLIAALQGFQAEAAAQAAAKGAPVAPVSTARTINEGCFGYEPVGPQGGPHAWAICDSSDPIDLSWEADPQTHQVKPNAAAHKVKLGSLKRQYNAIAKQYGHPEKQVKLSVAERLHLK
jgi:hypothetical protein